MRRILIQIGLLVMPILCLAQVSKQQAIETVMNTMINRDSVRVNVYVEPLLQTNEFYKLSPYDSISAPFIKGTNDVDEVLPIRNLSAEVLADNNVSLAWDMPSGYESGTATIGWTRSDTIGDMWQYGFDSYMAHLYDAADLKNHNGWRINSVRFYKTTTWTYSACIWKQEEGGEMSLIHSQEIAGDLPMGINEVELDADIYIMPETKYWIGLRATYNAGQTGLYPFATDVDPMVKGKGMLGMSYGTSTWDDNTGYSIGNLWLKVEVESVEGGRSNAEDELSGYRVYRNNQLIKEMRYAFVTYFTDDDFVRDVEAEYCVTAVYGESESERECATVTVPGVYEVLPVRNLSAEVLADNNVSLAWDMPSGYESGTATSNNELAGVYHFQNNVKESKGFGEDELSGYRVYRNNQLIKEITNTFETYFTDDDFVRDVEAEYCVTAVYGESESERECATITVPGVYEVLPVRNLSAEVLADDKVTLSWDMPSVYESGTTTITWTGNDTVGDMFQYGWDSYMAQLYDAADLKNHNGWRINSVSFYKTTTWTYSACVWKQEEGGEMSLIHSQEIAGDLPMGINEVELDADIYIMPETKYWIGLRATLNAGQTGVYPFATDGGTVVLGKGLLGMLPDGSEWGSDSFGSVVSGNLWLKVEVEKQESDKWNVELGENALNAYRLYRNSQLIKEIPYSFVTYFTDDDFVRDVEAEYCVTAVYGEDESERECATVTINGVQEDSAQCGVTISPNPTYGIVNIDGIMVSEATVYNALGQIIVKVFNTNVLTIEGARRGVYSMSLKDIDGNIITKKIVLK
ncbi:MAG: T9SS type A sorting domain-containing protein [Bacteroidales bacterium]|nr:T9SS type A sorting domain-containing protein [Bacteroidales bacterium]MDY6075388.1 T9SS type A sorting domain-containing protein [Bacteroidales bacterium]